MANLRYQNRRSVDTLSWNNILRFLLVVFPTLLISDHLLFCCSMERLLPSSWFEDDDGSLVLDIGLETLIFDSLDLLFGACSPFPSYALNMGTWSCIAHTIDGQREAFTGFLIHIPLKLRRLIVVQ